MPFIAVHKATQQRIDINTVKNPRATLKRGDYICPLCGGDLFIRGAHTRNGYSVQAHFGHVGNVCDARYDAHPESPEHLWAKLHLIEELNKAYASGMVQPTLDLEVLIEMPWRAKGRQADVLGTWPFGWRVAYEIQLSAISLVELEERTNDYIQAGIDVVWFLGKSADTPENRSWCRENFGESLSIQWYDNQNYSNPWSP